MDLFGWLDPVMAYYEKAKAKLYTALGNLMGLREKILELQDRAGRAVRAAESTGNPIVIKAARELRDQSQGLYRDQLDVEQKVLSARDRVNAVDQGAKNEGVGVLPLAAIAGAAAVVVAAVAAVVIHTQRVNYLTRAMDDLEKHLLTTPEYKAASGAAGTDTFGLGGLGELVKWGVIGVAVYYGVKMFKSRRA